MTTSNKTPLTFHQQVEPEGVLDKDFLLRKCHGRDCRFHGKYSFRRTGPDGTETHLHAHCDRLDCPTCRARMTDALSAKLLAAVQRHQLTTCYTLTLRDHPTPEAGFNHALQAFRRLKAAHLRKYGRPLPYILVKSLGQRQGHPHIHLMTTTDVPSKWLRDRWHRLTGATQVHRRLNQAADLPRLVTYMVKNYLLGFDHGLRGRKIQASAGIDVALKPRSDRSGPSEWKRAAVSTRSIALDLNGLQASDPAALMIIPNNPLQVRIPANNKMECERSEQSLRSQSMGRSAAMAGAEGDGPDDAAGGVRSSARGEYTPGGGRVPSTPTGNSL